MVSIAVSKRWMLHKQFREFEWGPMIGRTSRNPDSEAHNMTSHGTTDAAFVLQWRSVLSCVGTTLEHDYRCVIIYNHGSSTFAMSWAACKDFSAQGSPDVEPLTDLVTMGSPTKPVVLTGNMSSTRMSPATIWTKLWMFTRQTLQRWTPSHPMSYRMNA